LLAARALLAYQFCERDHTNSPTDLAQDGALLHAEVHDIWRAFARVMLK